MKTRHLIQTLVLRVCHVFNSCECVYTHIRLLTNVNIHSINVNWRQRWKETEISDISCGCRQYRAMARNAFHQSCTRVPSAAVTFRLQEIYEQLHAASVPIPVPVRFFLLPWSGTRRRFQTIGTRNNDDKWQAA